MRVPSSVFGDVGGVTAAPPGGIGRDQSARDRAALAAALDPIITIDMTGAIQSASDSVQRVLGWTPAELIGQNVSVLMPEPHHSAHDGYLASYQRTGQTNILNRPRRFEALHKQGTLIPIELCVSRADIPGAEAPLFVGIIRDMSAYAAAERSRDEERVRSQQLLAEQTKALQTAHLRLRMSDRMASIGTLAAGLGHDMNNVLLPVRARLNALKASGASGGLSRGDSLHVEEIQKSVAYLQQLADGLHYLALDPEVEEDSRAGGAVTDLRQWWDQAGPLLAKAVPRHVRVTATFASNLPSAAIPAHALTQAALNLIVNAGEAIPTPGARKRRQGTVRVSGEETIAEDGRAWIRLAVSDNGSGMSEEVRRRAMEMFFTTKPRGLGTGLGLTLVRNVVERAAGRVEINSKLGRGTTIAVTLPIADAAGASEPMNALISIADARAAALVRQFLELSGASVSADGDPAVADIWIVDPDGKRLAEVKGWRRSRPHGRLILFGLPIAADGGEWRALEPVTIENPHDFAAVRAAIDATLKPD